MTVESAVEVRVDVKLATVLQCHTKCQTDPHAVLQLSSLGIPEQCMVFTNVTMQSEKFVCVRETGTTNNVVIVDMANPSAPTRRPITAESTILAPSSKILALKAAASADGSSPGDNLQVFNLETKQKLKAYLNPTKVQFWAWLDDKTIGIVTENAVFHWHLEVRSDVVFCRTLRALDPKLAMVFNRAGS
jgi:clathrin heavy chain